MDRNFAICENLLQVMEAHPGTLKPMVKVSLATHTQIA
jgi:hypothetical protein